MCSRHLLSFLLMVTTGAGCTPPVAKPSFEKLKDSQANSNKASAQSEDGIEAEVSADPVPSSGSGVTPSIGGKTPSSAKVSSNSQPAAGTKAPPPPAPIVLSEIQVVSTKFTGEVGKLEALVKFAGATSPRLKFVSSGGIAAFKVPSLSTIKSDTLVVEIYEGERLRFLARRANTKVEKGKTNSWKLEDCSVTRVPWDGESNQGACGWTVQESN